MIEGNKMLVVSAHAADYVWRSGGVIAKYLAGGAQVKVVVLSLGIRGESNDLWKQPGQTEESVRKIRREECMAAAEQLGVVELDIWDWQDYPIELTPERSERMVRTIRAYRPDIILTHDRKDILNPDHNLVHQLVFESSVQSNSAGVRIGDSKPTRQMRFYGFEPHQTELSGFVPAVFVDISESFAQKERAMECFRAQGHLVEIYRQRAFLRGNHARRLSGRQEIRHAECFASVFPSVGDALC